MSSSGLCGQHDALASYRCEGCGKWLCYDCVEEDDSRFLTGAARCKYCGGKAAAVDDVSADFEATKPVA
ncbi:MAG: B-box zinc finger protein, partial [Thermoanaerobaculia bacterium]